MNQSVLGLKVTKRNGEVVDFDADRISNAIGKAVAAAGKEASQELIDEITQEIVKEVEAVYVMVGRVIKAAKVIVSK